jgi:hypothetical protein
MRSGEDYSPSSRLFLLHRIVEAIGPAGLDQLFRAHHAQFPGGTSRLTALPAATMASAPILTGAISAELSR